MGPSPSNRSKTTVSPSDGPDGQAAALPSEGADEAPEVQLHPPDLSPWRDGGTGVDHVHLRDSGRPGPTVMLVALTHGNELCGALALDWLLRQDVRPRQGRLVLAFANVQAFERFDPAQPFASRYVDEDLNRVWDDAVLRGPRTSAELHRARALRPFVDGADLLLDLHSMQEPGAPALTICGMTDKSVPLARALGQPSTLLVDTGHAAGLRLIDRGGFADPASPRQAVLVECGAHWEAASADMALDVSLRFLRHTGVVPADWADAHLRCPAPPRQRLVRVGQGVTARSHAFRFTRPVHHLMEIPHAGTLLAEDDGERWITPHDHCVLIMPMLRAGRAGQTMVRLGRYEDLPVTAGRT